MARIRTIKPEFFKHEELFDAEVETGLPLRLSFAGLWTCCDREGRFDWKPRALKTDILPYDEIDFSRVLDALVTRGFVVKYASGGKKYGSVTAFSRHQVVNPRETASKIPPPPQDNDIARKSTLEARVTNASSTRQHLARGEGKGTGRELEEEGKEVSSSSDREHETEIFTDTPDELFDRVLAASGRKNGNLTAYWMPPAATLHVWKWVSDLKLTPDQVVDVVRGAVQRFEGPPNGPKAFDFAMKSFAGALQAEAMQPIKGDPNGNGNSNRSNSNAYRGNDGGGGGRPRGLVGAAMRMLDDGQDRYDGGGGAFEWDANPSGIRQIPED